MVLFIYHIIIIISITSTTFSLIKATFFALSLSVPFYRHRMLLLLLLLFITLSVELTPSLRASESDPSIINTFSYQWAREMCTVCGAGDAHLWEFNDEEKRASTWCAHYKPIIKLLNQGETVAGGSTHLLRHFV